jgi:HEAT repeat protein
MESGVRAGLDQLASGAFTHEDLARFSDLSRDELGEFESGWVTLPDDVRTRAIRMMVEVAEADVTLGFGRIFRSVLHDSSPIVRQLAAGGLWEETGSTFAEDLLEVVGRDESIDVRAEAATALAGHAERVALGELDESYVEEFVERLTDIIADPEQPALVRRRCLETLGPLVERQEVQDLIRAAIRDDDDEMMAGAIHAMGRSRSQQWLLVILSMMESEENELRFEAARAAGLIGDPDAIPELSALLDDEDVEVRQMAIASIGEIGGKPAIRVLQRLSESDNAVDSEAIEDALEQAMIAEPPVSSPW